MKQPAFLMRPLVVCWITLLTFLTLGAATSATATNTVTLVASNTCWRYFDRGGDPGISWMRRGFDDRHWEVGFAELGYGDGDEKTVVSFGPVSTNKYITTYFRQAFNLANAGQFTNLILRLKRDDGAAVFLNGTEIFRDNLPPGLLFPTTLATNAADDGVFFQSVSVNPVGVLESENVLAVEIHQNLATSSDISFDLQLIGEAGLVSPSLAISHTGSAAVLTWPESAGPNFVLQSQATVGGPGGWTPVAGAPTVVNGQFQLIDTTVSTSRFYRLCAVSAELGLCEPPSIVSQPLQLPVAAGTNLTLNVVAQGDGMLTYQWRRNEVILEGETNSSLTLTNVQRASGGAYDVFIASACGCVLSSPTLVTVDGVAAVLSDDFAGRMLNNDPSGWLNASNAFATLEAGEPSHPSRVFGHTVWMGWTAPSNGVAYFNTAGSGQETALAVYTGGSLSNLVLFASAGPTGPERTSVVQFNAEANVEYQIVVDGAGLTAALNLNWALDPGLVCAPQIVQQPLTQITPAGSNATFTVVATACVTNTLAYQWTQDDVTIPAATNASLVVANVQPTNGMLYRVVVTSASGSVTSTPADIIVVSNDAGGAGAGFGPASIILSSGNISVPTANSYITAPCGKDLAKVLVMCLATSTTPPASCTGANVSGYFPSATQSPPVGTTLKINTIASVNARFDTALKFSVQIAGCICWDPVCNNSSVNVNCSRLSSSQVVFGSVCTGGSCGMSPDAVLVTVFYNVLSTGYNSGACYSSTVPATVRVNYTYQ